MSASRAVILGILGLLLAACGGGGGGGGDGGGGSSDLPIDVPYQAFGWFGGGQDGWRQDEGILKDAGLRALDEPADVFVDRDGNLYVADTENHRICKWSPDGVAIGWIGWGLDGWQTGYPREPLGAAVVDTLRTATDAEGNIYVPQGACIVKWDADGNVIGWIGNGVDGWQTDDWRIASGTGYRSFFGILGVHVTDDGTIYVAERGNHRISRWSSEGIAQGWIGGGKDGWQKTDVVRPEPDQNNIFHEGVRDLRSFYSVHDVHVDEDGNLYAADVGNARVVKWGPDGRAVGWIGAGKDGWQTVDSVPGQSGRDYRSFTWPVAVAIDASGDILVVEAENHRISRWSAGGTALGWIGHGKEGWQTTTVPSLGLCSDGDGSDEFDGPFDIALEAGGSILVAETNNHRVSRWDPGGHPLGWIGGGKDGWQSGRAPAEDDDFRSFLHPGGIDVDGEGRLVVTDSEARRVSRWSAEGQSLGWVGGGEEGWQSGDAPAPRGKENAFDYPEGVFVDHDGTIYVADSGHHRVSKWGADGIVIGWIGLGKKGWQTGRSDWRSPDGAGERWFDGPSDVWVAPDGTVYVADENNHRVCRWTAGGEADGWIGGGSNGWKNGPGAGPGGEVSAFRYPRSLGLGGGGRLYVADSGNHRISRWSASGEATGWLGGGSRGWKTRPAKNVPEDEEAGTPGQNESGPDAARFLAPRGIEIRDGWLYVADLGNHRLCRWRLSGSPWPAGWLGGGQDGWQDGDAPEDGTDPRSFAGPAGVSMDREGNLLVADSLNHRISRWTPEGAKE